MNGCAATRVGRMSASERRGATRTAVVWDALRPALEGSACNVLDIGGGTGGFAVRVAELGHQVTVVDPSPDALAALDRRAREIGVQVTGVQGDVDGLAGLVEGADVVLCHGVLEVVDDPATALATIRGVLRPGGTLSLLVAQRHAAVVARAMAGHFPQALALLDGRPALGALRPPVHRRGGHRPAGRRRLRGHHGARRPGLRRPGARLAARPRARRHRGPGRARAGSLRASRVPPPRHAAALLARWRSPATGDCTARASTVRCRAVAGRR